MGIGIEKINFYGGPASIDARSIFTARNLDVSRFDNLLIEKKSVGLSCEDAVTNGVNAAKPMLDALTEKEKQDIKLLITASESGIDFGKSISTYIHKYLELSNNCCLFEMKQACYAGTAAVHMAAGFVASNLSPTEKALVIATDVARAAAKSTYGEPTQSIGAVAMIISQQPDILQLDLGAYGDYSYEVMDTCRPLPEVELGDSDLSLLTYLDCLTNAYIDYKSKVEDVSVDSTFDYLVFHAPFGGMVKGAFRTISNIDRKVRGAELDGAFMRKTMPSLKYCMEVGNVYAASVYLGLCSLLDNEEIHSAKRVGLFSYGSGCSSKFYSGIITPTSNAVCREMKIKEGLDNRYTLNFDEYERIIDQSVEWIFGLRDKKVDISHYSDIYNHFFENKGYLVLKEIKDFHRIYDWS